MVALSKEIGTDDREFSDNGEGVSPNAEQTADIDAAWVEAEMFKLLVSPTAYRVIVVRQVDRRIIADFHATQTDHGLEVEHADAFFGMVGEKYTAKTLKEMNFDGGKLIEYNTLTADVRALV